MSVFDAHSNLSHALVTVAPVPALAGLALTVDDASSFPAAPFNAVVWPPDVCGLESNAEIVRVTIAVGDVFTILRAQEGTTAKAIAAGWQISNAATVFTFTAIEDGLTSVEGTVATLVVDVAAIQADAVFDGDPAGGVLDGTFPSPGLAAGVAGAGLAETGDVLSVNVDGSTIEINADALRVKDGGVTPAKLSFDPATQAELDAVAAGKISISEFNSKGDLLVGTGNDAFSALTVGADGKIAIADTNSAGGLIYANPIGQAGYASGAFSFSQFGGAGGAAGGFALNSLYGLPYWVGRRTTFSGIGLRCGAGTATLVVRLGIWTGTFGPTTLVLDAGTIDGASANADKIIGTTFTLDPGLHWLCGSAQVAGTIGAGFVAAKNAAINVPMLNRTDVISSPSRAYVKTGVTGAFANITPVASEFNSSQEGYLIALRAT